MHFRATFPGWGLLGSALPSPYMTHGTLCSPTILVLDQGTTGSTAALFSAKTLELLATTKQEFPQHYPTPGWVEHNPGEIWESIVAAIAGTLQKSALPASSIAAIGVTNQRETVVPFHRGTGTPLSNAIVWQDRRTAEHCAKISADTTHQALIRTRTGLVVDPYFSATKIAWLLEHDPAVSAAATSHTLACGTIDAFLVFKLTAGQVFCTDHTNASRTMLYGLASKDYDGELLQYFGVPREILPNIQPCDTLVGYTRNVPGLPDGIPITGVIGDQQAALFGHHGASIGVGKITYGTGAFLLATTGTTPTITEGGLLTTPAYVLNAGQQAAYALEGSAFIAGAAIQFVRDNLRWITTAPEIEHLIERDARDPALMFVPAFTGLGAPYWNPHAKATLFGLSRGSSQSQIARAILESIALQNVALVRCMQQHCTPPLAVIGVDGGAANSNYLMQFQTDTIRLPLHRGAHTEMTAYGAARMARRALGFDDSDLAHGGADTGTRVFTPQMDAETAQEIVYRWGKAAEAVDTLYRS